MNKWINRYVLDLVYQDCRSSIFESKLTTKINIFPINFIFTERILLVEDSKMYVHVGPHNVDSDAC